MQAELDPIFNFLRGRAGNFIYRKVRGKTIISPKPVFNGTSLSPAQAEQRERFMAAVAYGKTALADNETRPLYEELAKKKDLPVFALIVADYFNAPVIHTVNALSYNGNIGDTITITASDDIGVQKVEVAISDDQGNPLETGAAIETAAGSGQWVYTATAQGASAVRIQVTATDRPGGSAVTNIEKSI